MTVTDVELAIDSSAAGASPQFTLTCISTGGPATTVTWTRDSVNVTEGTETVLDDPLTAKYTHTLAVTPPLGLEYKCTIANNKPSNQSATYILEGIYSVLLIVLDFGCYNFLYIAPGQPTIHTNEIADTTIFLSWSVPSGSVVDSYVLEWSSDQYPGDEVENSTTMDGTLTNFTISDLRSDTNYNITVNASNAAGNSTSKILTVHTPVMGEVCVAIKYFVYGCYC